ncbi:MAG: hypothetical protein RSD77_07605 [Romboutsia sp.]
MKTLNNRALDARKKAMESSKKIVKDYKVFTAPLEVKQKRAILGATCGTVGVLVGGAFYVVKSYNIATGLVIGGVVTLGVNLATSKVLSKK